MSRKNYDVSNHVTSVSLANNTPFWAFYFGQKHPKTPLTFPPIEQGGGTEWYAILGQRIAESEGFEPSPGY